MENIWSHIEITNQYIRTKAIYYSFEGPTKVKKFRGRERITLLILIYNDILEAVKYHQQLQIRQFRTTEDLDTLRNVAKDHSKWKIMRNWICSIVQSEK